LTAEISISSTESRQLYSTPHAHPTVGYITVTRRVRTRICDFLDDYACLVFGLLELYETGFEKQYLRDSVKLAKIMIAKFWDALNGGFYLTTQTNDTTVPRKQATDGAAPSGNSVALHGLQRLAILSGETAFNGYANKLLLGENQGVPDGLYIHINRA